LDFCAPSKDACGMLSFNLSAATNLLKKVMF
jgi:hypothetical protein